MTYLGELSSPIASESGRFLGVFKVRIGPDGRASDVLWGEVDAGNDRAAGARVLATAAEVVDAIHDGAQVEAVFSGKGYLPARLFAIVLHADGRECSVTAQQLSNAIKRAGYSPEAA